MDTLPPGYVTIAHLYQRWIQSQQEEKENEEKKELENEEEKKQSGGGEVGTQNVVVAVENENCETWVKNSSNVSNRKGKRREQVENVKGSSFYGRGKGKGQRMIKQIVADGEHPSYIEGFDGGMLNGGVSGVLIRGGDMGASGKSQQGIIKRQEDKIASVKEGMKKNGRKDWRRERIGRGRVSGGGKVSNNKSGREYRVKEGAGEDGGVTFGSGKMVEDEKKGGYGRREGRGGRRVNGDSYQEKKNEEVEDDLEPEKKANGEVLDAVSDGNAATLGDGKGSSRNKTTGGRRFGGQRRRYARTGGPNLKQRDNQENKEDGILKPEKEDCEMVKMVSGIDRLTVRDYGNGFLRGSESSRNKTRGRRVGGRGRYARTGRYGHRSRQEPRDGKRMVWVKKEDKSGPDAAHGVGSSGILVD